MATTIARANVWNHCQPGERYVKVDIIIETFGKRYRAWVYQEVGSHQGYLSANYDRSTRALGLTPEEALAAAIAEVREGSVYDAEVLRDAVATVRERLALRE